MQRSLAVDVLVSPEDRRRALEADVRSGLSRPLKAVPPVWFYDETGSRLFDLITRLPEYYPTRTESAILEASADAIAARAGADTLVELGSGTSDKTRRLLDAMAARGRLRRIVLLDISEEVLREAAEALGRRYDVDVHAITGDFRHHLGAIPSGGRRLWAFLGGTIGNFAPPQRADLLRALHAALSPGDRLLLGTDLVKDPARLVAAYDDAQGVTAAFNRNLLAVLNRELGATFLPELFDHVAAWNQTQEWIEMRLRARERHTVTVADLGLTVPFARGEDLLTEISAKFRPDRLADELAGAGLTVDAAYRDPAADFQLTLAARG